MIKFSDLDQRQVQEISEAFAKREGIWRDDIPVMRAMYGGRDQQIGVRSTRPDELSDYPNCKNAMGRIIKGMTYSTELYRYHSYLTAMFEASVGEYAYVKMLTATAQQQFVAAAMALGLIKETK